MNPLDAAPALDPALREVLRLALAWLLLAHGAAKARAPRVFAAAVARYRLLPARATLPAAAVLIVAELASGAALLVPSRAAAGALAAAALLAAYGVAIAINLARGRRALACGCGGASDPPLSAALLARNVVLVAAALAAALPAGARALGGLDALSIAGATALLALLWQAVHGLLAQAPALAALAPRSGGPSGLHRRARA